MGAGKVSFAQNDINSFRKIADDASLYQSYCYEHKHGQLIYAVVRHEHEHYAHSVAISLINSANTAQARS